MTRALRFLVAASWLALTAPVCAQWSVIEDDPRPRTPPHLYEVFTKEAWNQSNFATPEELQWFRDAKYGMFVHFGLSTYQNAELSWGVCKVRVAPDRGSGPYPTEEWTAWKDEMRLPDFDAQLLVQHARDAGMRYVVVIAKHHDGFHLWDTKLSEFKITRTPFGRDFLKEIADACHAAGMRFGIYYSQRDWYHPDYEPTDWKSERHQRYLRYQNAAIRELCTNYGKVDIFWFDAVSWGGMFRAEMWDAENLTRMIRALQPGILINNRTSVPGDFDTPEQRLGMFQEHRAWESCLSLCTTWSYSGTPSKSPKQLVDTLIGTLCGDGNLLMSWGPTWNGSFAPAQIAALAAAGAWVKKNEQAIFGTRGGPWPPQRWGGSVSRDKSIYLHLKSLPASNELELEGLKPRVLQARIHGSVEIPFQQSGDRLRITVPRDGHDPLATVVELTLDSPASEIIVAPPRKSVFESPDYGGVISDDATLEISSASPCDHAARHPQLFTGALTGDEFAFHTADELNPHAILDLGEPRSICGILIRHRAGQPTRKTHLAVSISLDRRHWKEVWTGPDTRDVTEVFVTKSIAGAFLPGDAARYVKIERRLEKPDALHLQSVTVYGY